MFASDVALQEGIEDRDELRRLRNVLAKKGALAGTEIQIKPVFRKKNPDEILPSNLAALSEASAQVSQLDSAQEGGNTLKAAAEARGPENKQILGKSPIRQDSRITVADGSFVLDNLQLIIKWGGEPTHSARYQSQELGANMRNDLLLMNRRTLDEVHVFSSSKRRATTSAQIWASVFTDQKDLPSDFITIHRDLLDDSNAAKDEKDKVKKKLKVLLRQGNEAPPQFAWPTNMPEPSIVLQHLVQLMKFHRMVLRANYDKLYAPSSLDSGSNPGHKERGKSPNRVFVAAASSIQSRWCCGEDLEIFKERWEVLFREFCDNENVDPSKISELYDTLKFDALHNRQFLEWVFTPSKSILEEEEKAIRAEGGILEGEEEQPRTMGEGVGKQTIPMNKVDTNKSLSRLLPRRSSGITEIKKVEERSEQYFRRLTGSSQTWGKTDTRLEKLRELYKLAKVLFDYISPQEYGITDAEKLEIGLLTSLPLLRVCFPFTAS
jgi:inositol hexakisphosphate/diphosphoinositol-pentakisphosphate kinase